MHGGPIGDVRSVAALHTDASEPPDRVVCRSSTLVRRVSVSTVVPAEEGDAQGDRAGAEQQPELVGEDPAQGDGKHQWADVDSTGELGSHHPVSCRARVEAVTAGQPGEVGPCERSTGTAASAWTTRAIAAL